MKVLDAYGRLKVTTDGGITVVDAKSGFTIPDPTSSEKVPWFHAKDPLRITQLTAVLIGSGSPSVTWTVRFGADITAAGTEVVSGGTATTNTTTGDKITTLDNVDIPAGSFVWVETTAKSGTVNYLHVTMNT